MRKYLIGLALFGAFTTSAAAQSIKVSPSETTVYSQGATSVLLTFGNLGNRLPAESTWCGALVSAAPDIGLKCDPNVIFGRLPIRYNQSRLSGNNGYTDIMSVTPSVARRAYLDAAHGSTATFFYVRRFTLPAGGPDEYVPVTLRLGGNGAAVPFSITNVRLLWDGGTKTVPFVKSGEILPRITAEIFYTGSGRLVGRWEIVKPGETAPSQRDLLPEATLPIEERGTQRRFTQVKRFNIFLPPVGRITIPGPENQRIEKGIDGMYLLLFRVESVTDGLNQSNLQDVNAGQGTVNSGGASGFAMPTLRYYVGTGGAQVDEFNAVDYPLAPADMAEFSASQQIVFTWPLISQAKYYKLQIEDVSGAEVHSAVLLRDTHTYRAPSWLFQNATSDVLRWRVVAFDSNGKQLSETVVRALRILRN
ncbi:MAG TPA: hypothetical protein VHP99_04635 [Pyrinomonadaceae bacterium]|nr:hypothetical protein [Pyrinomonadaceae bacterium]